MRAAAKYVRCWYPPGRCGKSKGEIIEISSSKSEEAVFRAARNAAHAKSVSASSRYHSAFGCHVPTALAPLPFLSPFLGGDVFSNSRFLHRVLKFRMPRALPRDLKPENILLVGRDNDVDVKITDFGLAKRANKEGLKTFCGTPQYFAPEVLKRRNTVLGVGRYGKEADMWSVGERRWFRRQKGREGTVVVCGDVAAALLFDIDQAFIFFRGQAVLYLGGGVGGKST